MNKSNMRSYRYYWQTPWRTEYWFDKIFLSFFRHWTKC